MATILVIEDDLSLRQMTKALLEMEGYTVMTSANGREGLDAIELSRPDLILLDMKMPVMDGWEFSRICRARYGSAIPIMVVTASADARQRAADIHADGYIGKPFDIDLLCSRVRDVLGSAAELNPSLG